MLVDVEVAAPTALPLGDDEFDLAVVDDTAGALTAEVPLAADAPNPLAMAMRGARAAARPARRRHRVVACPSAVVYAAR